MIYYKVENGAIEELPLKVFHIDSNNIHSYCKNTELDIYLVLKEKKLHKLLIDFAHLDELHIDTRNTVEKVKPLLITNVEMHRQKDHAKQTNAGIDLPTIKFMKENGTYYAIELKNLIYHAKKGHTWIVARYRQNYTLLKKTKSSFFILTEKELPISTIKSVLHILE